MVGHSAKLAVLTPVYNDWECLMQLINDLESLSKCVSSIELLVVNDGSWSPIPEEIQNVPSWLESIKVLDLVSNVGHQRAIAIGLCHLVKSSTADAILTLDSDGEDNPQSTIELIGFWMQHRSSIVVAARGRRSEGRTFSCLYKGYKLVFPLFTGVHIDFGNFAVLPLAAAKRLAAMPELWNHYPATILRSRIKIKRLLLERGKRYAGESKMGLAKLISHGLSSMSVFLDVALARLLLSTVMLATLLTGLALAFLVIKLSTNLAIPGWTSLVFGLTSLGILQVLTIQIVVIFLALSSRSTFQMPTMAVASAYIDAIRIYQSN